jgi:hypothetical protein
MKGAEKIQDLQVWLPDNGIIVLIERFPGNFFGFHRHD